MKFNTIEVGNEGDVRNGGVLNLAIANLKMVRNELNKNLIRIFVINVPILVVFEFVGHLWPQVSLFLSPVLFLFLIFFNLKFVKLEQYWIVFYTYFLILFHDFIFRIFGGGIHDDAGKGWIELMFYMTWTLSTLIFIFFSFYKPNGKAVFNLIITLSAAFLTYLIYRKFNIPL